MVLTTTQEQVFLWQTMFNMTDSPCVNVCELDSDFVCKGCSRTIEEILKWREYTEVEKQNVLDRIFGDSQWNPPSS